MLCMDKGSGCNVIVQSCSPNLLNITSLCALFLCTIFWTESSSALQLCAYVLCLQPADIYLIDEPSAYLDSEQRIVAAKVIKRFILHAKTTAFVVEHDFIMATYLADRVIVYEGEPSIDCVANTPQSLLTGMNLFLSVSLGNLY